MNIDAHAKLNLTLDVAGQRSDGYHLLRTVMHAITLCDTVTVEPADETTVDASRFIPHDNTAFRAAELFREMTGHTGRIYIEKRIPDMAGMGGASADAAAVLFGLAALYGFTDKAALMTAAAKVGADVPFCLNGGTALCEGIGEIITPLPDIGMSFFIAKPPQGVSTKALFDRIGSMDGRSSDGMTRAVINGDAGAVARLLHNDLTAPAVCLVPEIADIIRFMLENGALGASMTGSGSAVFGIMMDESEAMALLSKANGRFGWECFVSRSCV